MGLVRDQTGWMLDILGDPAQTGVVIVAAPEEMPVNETLELAERLTQETVVDLAAVVVNRVLPELFGRGEEEIFDQLDGTGERGPPERGARRVGPARSSTAPQLAVTLRRTRAAHLARLRDELPVGHAAAVRAVPVPAQPRRAGHPTGRRRTSPRSSGY